jgi:hypothetical protein
MPYRNGNIVWNATVWTDAMILFLRSNWKGKTNRELASALGLRLTVTRNKLRELGLKRMELEYWNKDMMRFLKKSYKTLGDVEIMDFFKKLYPKNKGWKRGAIRKKRMQMGLMRSDEQCAAILKRHRKRGGRMYTIDRNSSSINLTPLWVAQRIAWRNPELQRELVNHPEIIDAARVMILLKRKIKSTKSEKAA